MTSIVRTQAYEVSVALAQASAGKGVAEAVSLTFCSALESDFGYTVACIALNLTRARQF